MKARAAIAVLLAATLGTDSFAQTVAASVSASASSASGAAGTIKTVPPSLGSLTPVSMSAPSMTPALAPALSVVPALTPAVASSERMAVTAIEAIAAAPVRSVPSAETVKPASVIAAAVPAALRAAPSAAAKSEGGQDKGWAAKLTAMFDGGSAKKGDDLEDAPLKAFVVRHGKPMEEITLEQAAARGGQVRLLYAPNDPTGLAEKDAEKVRALLAAGGAKATVSKEKLAVDWSPKAAATAAAADESAKTEAPKSKLTWPFREAKFLAKTFVGSLVKPLTSEVIGGVATKSFPLVTSIGVYWAAVGLAHPFALGGLIALSLTQEIFHGIFLKSWNNFQEALSRERGFNYQMFFNLAYMQGFGTLYRLLSWSANPKSVTPPWSVTYWQDMAVMSVVGTFFGVMGYNGLNTLYAKGAIKRWQHSGIQQMRDLLFLLAGPFFASGSMTVFWGIFLFQQSLDLAIAIWAGRAQSKPIVFVTSAAIAASPEFAAKYPAAGAEIVPPLKQAWSAVTGNPLVRLMTWPARAAWKAVRGGKK